MRTLLASLGAVLALSGAPVHADATAPSGAAGDGRPLPHAGLLSLYESWFEHPYDYMFDPNGPLLAIRGHELGPFTAGIGGILRYGALTDAAAKYLKQAAPSFGDLAPIGRLAGLALYRERDERGDSFSRYHPAIVRWGYRNLIPQPADRVGGHSCQELYDRLFRRFFRLMTESYVHLEKDRSWDREVAAYQRAMKARRHFDGIDYLHQRYAQALPRYQTAQDGTRFTAPMALGFWLRRKMDGTAPDLWTGLARLMALYDAAFFNSLDRPG